jgi:hypothetical protein
MVGSVCCIQALFLWERGHSLTVIHPAIWCTLASIQLLFDDTRYIMIGLNMR